MHSVPRAMIVEQVRKVAHEAQCEKGLIVTVSVPEGECVGAKTFNAACWDIEGGICRNTLARRASSNPAVWTPFARPSKWRFARPPSSETAGLWWCRESYGDGFADTVAAFKGVRARPMRQLHRGCAAVRRARGRASAAFAGGPYRKDGQGRRRCDEHPFPRRQDCRRETLCAHAAIAGADQACARELMDAATTDACLAILENAPGSKKPSWHRCQQEIQRHLDRHAPEGLERGAPSCSTARRTELLRTDGAQRILDEWEVFDGR